MAGLPTGFGSSNMRRVEKNMNRLLNIGWMKKRTKESPEMT